MPTAAKLVGAIFFAILGYFTADLVKPLLPEGTKAQWLNETVAAFGMLFGWTMAGSRAGDGYRAALGYGLTAAALMAFWSVVAFAGAEMLQRSIDHRYRGPMAAVKSMFGIAWGMFKMIAIKEIIIAAIIGGMFGGWLAEWASKRWN